MPSVFSVEPHHAGIATVVVLAFLMTTCVAWFGYAYFVPHSWSGQLLIKVSPYVHMGGREVLLLILLVG